MFSAACQGIVDGMAMLPRRPSIPGRPGVAHTLAALVDRLTNTPAMVVDEIGDILSANALARELFSAFPSVGPATGRRSCILHHPVVGAMVVDEVVLGSAAEPGSSVVIYVPPPESSSADALRILGILCTSKGQS